MCECVAAVLASKLANLVVLAHAIEILAATVRALCISNTETAAYALELLIIKILYIICHN